MNSRLAVLPSILLLVVTSSLSAQESKPSLEAYFQRLKSFPKVSVVEELVSNLLGEDALTQEITPNRLRQLLERNVHLKAESGEVTSSKRKDIPLLQVISIPSLVELQAEQQLLVEDLFSTEEFADAILTTKVKENNQSVALFIPKGKIDKKNSVALYIFITEGQEKMLVRLTGNYTVNTSWHITEKDRQKHL